MSKKAVLGGLFVIGAFAASGPASAERLTVVVPRDFATIQEAVDFVGPDATISVLVGTYREAVVLGTRAQTGVKIVGAGAGTVIESPDGSPAITIEVDHPPERIVVSDLTLHSTGDGVFVGAATRVTLERVAAVDCGIGIHVFRTDDVTVRDCTISGARDAGIDIQADPIDSPHVPQLRLDSNVVAGAGGDGVRVWGQFGLTATRNRVTDCGGAGLSFDGAGAVSMTYNEIAGVGGDGIRFTGAGPVVIEGNKIGFLAASRRVGGDGIRVESPPAGVFVGVDQNAVRNPAGAGVRVFGASGTKVMGNRIENAGDAGIVVQGTNMSVSGTSVKGGRGDGFVVEGDGNYVNGYVEGVQGAGVVVRGALARVELTTILRVGGDGVRVLNGPTEGGVTVRLCRITKAGDDGIDLGAASNCVVEFNTVRRAGDHGVEIGAGVGNVLGRNVVKGSRSYDLFESGDAASNTVRSSNRFQKMNKRTRKTLSRDG